MALISNAKGRGENGTPSGYERLFGNRQLGLLMSKVQEHFKAFYPHNSSHKTIYKWVVKYADMISNFTDKLKINSENH